MEHLSKDMKMAVSIERKGISPDAFSVVTQLQRAGYEAYLVGGCVRDLIMKRTPKDWDVTTNATPDQIIALFL
jgi:poly(A) polymerase